jgi:hypothetical protein
MSTLHVYVDAEKYYPVTTMIRGSVAVRDAWNRSTTQANLDMDPYSGGLMCAPIQYNADWKDDIRVVRYGLDLWTGITSAWEETTDAGGVAKWLHMVVGTAVPSRISTVTDFEANSGFLFQVQLCGSPTDKVDAFTIEFGQWKWKLNTSGKCYLYKGTELRHVDIYSREALGGAFLEISIQPGANNTLRICPHRHTGAGIAYRLPDAELTDDPPIIIESGAFAVSAEDVSLKQVQLTQLTYDDALDYMLVSEPLSLPYAPLTEQLLSSIEFDSLSGGGGAACQLWVENVDTPFVSNGYRSKYRAVWVLAPTIHATPIVRGLHFQIDATTPPPRGTPAEITADIKELTIETSETAEYTEARIKLRNPATYNLFGACNRMVEIKLGASTLFLGYFKEPPKYVNEEDGTKYYELTVGSIYRLLETNALLAGPVFDGQNHVDVVTWLCQMAGIQTGNMSFDTSDGKLPETRKTAEDKGGLCPEYADTSSKWISSICDETGWLFTDGHAGGDFVLKYIDPTLRTAVPVIGMTLLSVAAAPGTPRIRSWEAYSQEPESNELHVVGCNESGQLMDAIYLDLASQNPLVAIPDRDDNWLGYRKVAAFSMDGQTTEARLQEVALRIGADVCIRHDLARFQGDWPEFLWTGDVVAITDGVAVSNYRITGLSLEFLGEGGGLVPTIRRADYLAEKVG